MCSNNILEKHDLCISCKQSIDKNLMFIFGSDDDNNSSDTETDTEEIVLTECSDSDSDTEEEIMVEAIDIQRTGKNKAKLTIALRL